MLCAKHGGAMKWCVLWRRDDFSVATEVCEDMDQVKSVHDYHDALGSIVWIEDPLGRTTEREELDRLA
jgi:hypothetical protein